MRDKQETRWERNAPGKVPNFRVEGTVETSWETQLETPTRGGRQAVQGSRWETQRTTQWKTSWETRWGTKQQTSGGTQCDTQWRHCETKVPGTLRIHAKGRRNAIPPPASRD